jgi:two-component system response regulator AlgR
MIRVLIVDTELSAGIRIERLLATMKNIEVLGIPTTGADALAVAQRSPPDILIINLSASNMDKDWVTELVQQMDLKPVLIFCPSFDGFNPMPEVISRKDSFNMRLTNSEDVVASILGASRLVHKRRREACGAPRTHLYVYSYLGIEKIPVAEVLLFRAGHKYVMAHLPDRTVTINDSLKSLMTEFSGLFVKIHRNTLVAIKVIDRLQPMDDHVTVVIKGLDIQPTVSRRRVSYLRQLMPLL